MTLGMAPTTRTSHDMRTPGQRRHDALLTGWKLLFASGRLPNAGGVATMLVLSMDGDDFGTDTGVATTGHGYPVPVSVAKRWLDPEARVLLTLLSKTRGILAYCDKQRLFTEQQRWAMFARDRGCTYPGCDAPLGWLDAHHVTDWQHTHRTTSTTAPWSADPTTTPSRKWAGARPCSTADPTGSHPAGSTPTDNPSATTSTTGSELSRSARPVRR